MSDGRRRTAWLLLLPGLCFLGLLFVGPLLWSLLGSFGLDHGLDG